MKIDGSDLITVEPGLLWPLLQDANALRRILPGCEELTSTAANEYRVEVRHRIGPYDDLFAGTMHLSEKDVDSCLRVVANLESPNGLVHITGDINLEPTDESRTLLRYEGEVELGGRLTSVPPRLLETTANAYVRRMLEALERETATNQPYGMRRGMAAPVTQPSTTSHGLALPGWLVPALGALAGLALWRYFGNRPADCSGRGDVAGKTTLVDAP